MAGPTNRDFDTEVLERIAEGESLRAVCADLKDFGCPSASRFAHRYLDGEEPFTQRYVRARELQASAWESIIRDHSEKCRMGEIVTEKPDGGREVKTVDCVERSRLEVDALKWLLAKLHPRKYGEKVEQTQIHEVGNSVLALMDDIRKGKTRPNDPRAG